MVQYGITLVPLEEYLRDVDPTLFPPFCANDAAFDGLARGNAVQLCLMMDRGADQGNFPKPTKLLFIGENLKDEEVARW